MIGRVVGRSDPWLLAAVLLLVPFGVLMVHTSTVAPADDARISAAALRQAVIGAGGLVAMLALSRFDYRSLQRPALGVYAAVALLLVAVLFAGASEFGARRWLGVAGATLQPSEAAKLALVLALAAFMSGRRPGTGAQAVALALLLPPLVLVALQPDAGTAIVLVGAWAGAVVAWGVSWRRLGTLLAAGLALTPLLFTIAVPGYQRERLAVFLDPTRDPLGSGFNLRQAEVALRSGGLTGQRLFGSAGSALDHVGARSSDFMFARVGEELGLLGGALVLALLGVVVWRGLRAARVAPDAFGRLLAAGLTVALFTQAFVHIAVNLRLFPVTGIPLPFISQGGSSLLAMLITVGLLQSIASQHPPSAREQWSAMRWR